MFEGEVNDAVGLSGGIPQAVEIIEIAASHLRPGGGERSRRCIRAGQPEHLMTCAQELRNNGGADLSGRASDEYAHENFLQVADAGSNHAAGCQLLTSL